MAPPRKAAPEPSKRRRPPATTPEARENQLVSLAFDLAEKQLADGTASAQVITHYLKIGTARENLERMKIRKEVALLEARETSIISQAASTEIYEKALKAFRGYSGQDEEEEYEDPNVF